MKNYKMIIKKNKRSRELLLTGQANSIQEFSRKMQQYVKYVSPNQYRIMEVQCSSK